MDNSPIIDAPLTPHEVTLLRLLHDVKMIYEVGESVIIVGDKTQPERAMVYAEKVDESYIFQIRAKTKRKALELKKNLKQRLHAERYKNISG